MGKHGKTKTHKAQHFVPQCYTKAWVDPASVAGRSVDPYVWVFDKDGSGARKKSPKNLFSETDIYTINLPDGSRDLRLEHGFQELEDRFTRIRNLVFKRGQWPDAVQTAYLFAFVAVAQVRTASFRDFQANQWRGIREHMEDMDQDMRRATPEQRRAASAISSIGGSGKGMTIEDVRLLEEHPIQEMIGPMVAGMLPILARMHVAVLHTTERPGFVTTDHPSIMFDPESYKLQPIYRGAALASASIEVTMPISPDLCLYITHHGRLRGYVEAPPRMVSELNRRHIAYSQSTFVSCSSEVDAAWFEVPPMPEDAWENVRARKIAAEQAARGPTGDQ